MRNDDLASALSSAVKSVACDWKKAKRQADREDRVSKRALHEIRFRPQHRSIRDAAFSVMESAYLKASDNGRYSANARQIYYAARPAILAQTGAENLDSRYFTQTLLKEYMERRRPGWDVVYDDRGHLSEPHTEEVIGLGGLAVRGYIGGFSNGTFDEAPEERPNKMVPTSGPALRYGAVLFLEKEGFNPLLREARIAERYDIAIASTKGLPVSAMCDLLAELRRHGIKAYVVHDFDKSGFSIVSSLRHGTRGSRGGGEIIDLGFRLADIEGLEREEVTYAQREDPGCNLRENGATEDEISMLARREGYGSWGGERVELNAMTADQFIAWLEGKLNEQGIEKVIPDADTLIRAYRRATYLQRLEAEAAELRAKIADDEVAVPGDLEQRVRDMLDEGAEGTWDEAIWEVAEAGEDGL